MDGICHVESQEGAWPTVQHFFSRYCRFAILGLSRCQFIS